MATADELLSRSVSGDDKTLVVDNYLRTINIPKGITNLGVENDDDVLELNFKLPRYLGTIDLSAFSIRINYLNAQGESDIYTVNKPTIGADSITFTWLVGPTATRYKGNTKFNVCLRIVNAEGIIDKEYNTTIATLPVLEGLEVDEGVVTEYSDILEQWRRELFGIGDTEEAAMRAVSQEEQENITKKGAEVLATIPEEYQETANAAQEGIRTKADAVVCSAKGNPIVVSDSSDDHIRGLRVFGKTIQASTTGKNLFDVSQIVGHTSLINIDGVVTVITPATSTAVSTGKKISELAPLLEIGETYILTFDTTGTNDYIYLEGDNHLWTSGYSKTITQEILDSTVMLYASGVSTVAKLSNIMIRLTSNTDGTYEPYSGGVASPSPTMTQSMNSIENPDISMRGKNLIDCSDVTISETDGYYHTFDTGFAPIIGETYTLSMDVTTEVFPFAINIGCGKTAYHSDMTPKVSGVYYENGRVSLTFVWQPIPTQLDQEYTKLYIRAPRYGSPTTFNATVSNIQLELGDKATDYEPYRGSQNIAIPYALPGIPVTSEGNYTDANGRQWVCDEVDFEQGMYIQRVQTIVLDGTEDITREERSGGTYRFVLRQFGPIRSKPTLGGYCSHFPYDLSPISDNSKNNVLSLWTTGYPYCRFDDIESVEAMATWLAEQYAAGTPVTIKAVRETPIETPLTAEELAAFKALRTNYPNTTVINDSGAMMELKYNADIETWITNYIRSSGGGGGGSIARISYATILASEWVGAESPYSQVVQIEGVTENSQVDLTPSIEQLAAFYNKDLAFVTENDGGVVTVYALGDKPANDYTIQVTITEVYR